MMANLDKLAHAERPQDQKHHTGRDIRERALQHKADGETGSAHHCDQSRGLDTERPQHQSQDQDRRSLHLVRFWNGTRTELILIFIREFLNRKYCTQSKSSRY